MLIEISLRTEYAPGIWSANINFKIDLVGSTRLSVSVGSNIITKKSFKIIYTHKGRLRFDSRQEFHLHTTASRLSLDPMQSHIKYVQGILSQEVKQPGLGTDHSLQSSLEVKNGVVYLHFLIRLHDVLFH
jgi:hypothetical protein